jgi:hypothetical protein
VLADARLQARTVHSSLTNDKGVGKGKLHVKVPAPHPLLTAGGAVGGRNKRFRYYINGIALGGNGQPGRARLPIEDYLAASGRHPLWMAAPLSGRHHLKG